MLKKLLFVAIVICLCLFVFPQKQVRGKTVSLNTQIEGIMKDFNAIGLSVVVVKNGQIVYQHAYGYNPDYNDVDSRNLIRKNNLYYLASVSKTFVGTAIMQLVEKGKLSLDDDVNEYLDFNVRNPYFPETPITIKMLLSHHSSLKKGADYDSFDKLRFQPNEKIKTIFNNYNPGSAADYSNLGFVILGAVIEKVSGLRFDHYIRKNMLKPLNLYGSYNMVDLDSSLFVRTFSFNHKSSKFVKQEKTYRNNRKLMEPYSLGYSTPALRPAGGMVISPEDLAKYMIMHINLGKGRHGKRILSEQSEKLMWQRQGESAYGLSFVHFMGTIPNEDLVGMTGGAYGIHSAMLFQPQKKFGFVVICNGCTAKSADGLEMNKLIIRALYKAFITN